MATIGQMQEFDPANDRISTYLERVQLFFLANGIEDEKRVPVLLSVIGGKTYALLSDLLAPAKPASKSFDELKEVLRKHYEPKPVIIAERFQFHRRNQAANETVTEYEAELRRLATHCAFGDYLSEAIRDRIVCGLRNESIQKRLLAETELTLKKTMEIAQGMEAADRNAQRLKGGEPNLRVGEISRGTRNTKCYRCGSDRHIAKDCRYKETECRFCKKKGHLAKMCFSRGTTATNYKNPSKNSDKNAKKDAKWLAATTGSEGTEIFPDTAILSIGDHNNKPMTVQLELNGQKVHMEVDTGAAVSLMSIATQKKLFPNVKLKKSAVQLQTYTSESLSVLGTMEVQVRYGSYVGKHTLYVVNGNGPTLFGREWLMKIRLNWQNLGVANIQNKQLCLKAVLDKYSEVFKNELGTLKGVKAKLSVKPGTKPQFSRPRQVPYALRDAVDRQLKWLEDAGVIESVPYSEWATPLVAVPKNDGGVRLCGDYKKTLNPFLETDQYPLPRPEDLMTCLTGGCKFSKLDLSAAYQQMVLDEESCPYVTINTQRGLYKYLRLPFGVSSAPAVFQKAMDTILQGLPQVICYLDDILVTGSTPEEHLKNLAEVLDRLSKHGLRLKQGKCSFMQDSVEYLGHRIDAEGVHTTTSKVEAIVKAPPPKNTTELRSFLGMVNYYGKFVPNLADKLHPLHALLKNGVKWNWSDECAKVFTEIKKYLSEAPVLLHYNPKLPIRLAGDASNYGIGAVLSHVDSEGHEHPIAFTSRSLSASEKNYSQVEKALSLIHGIRKFRNYIYGRHFTLVTDHRPLTALFGPKNGVPALAAGRLQRWALFLSSYNYTIEFRPTKAHANADGLSRLPLPTQDDGESLSEVSVFNVSQINTLSVSVIDLCKATRSDPVLGKVYYYLQKGWPRLCPDLLKPFWSRRNELSVEEGCILWGVRVLVPKKLQPAVLEMLHEGHTGVVRVKQIARSHVWWPCIDKDIENLVKACTSCQQDQRAPVAAPLHPWIWPSKPWVRVHLDFAGPFMGKTFLITVDAFSKWPEIIEMSSTTATNTIKVLRDIFSRHGLPEQLVSDNGPQFISSEFSEFCKINGVKHFRVAPYHPASNGLAERMVQTFKQSMRRSINDGIPFQQRLANFLLTYRTTPHATTNIAPCELLMGRALRTRLDLLRPNLEMKVCSEQAKQKQRHDERSKVRNFKPGDTVWIRDFRGTTKWISGVIVQNVGPVSYMIQLQDGTVHKRHLDHIHQRVDNPSAPTSSSNASQATEESPLVTYPVELLPTDSESSQSEQSQSTISAQNNTDLSTAASSSETRTTAPRRNPPRNRKPPRRFQT